jgi:hypothetical protein
MILSAALYEIFDRCPRRFALERTHEPRTISPFGLMYAGVEGGLTSSNPCEGARAAIRALAAVKDIDSPVLAAISAVRHVGLVAEVVALALRRKLGPVRRLEPVPLGSHQWASNLFETRRGELHRIVLVSHIDDDVLRGFAHSWGTVGELAVLERDVNLTFVAIGPQRNGRRHSHWSKCFRHPIQRNMLRFARRKSGKQSGFTSGWVEAWRETLDISAASWLTQMENDGVLGDLIQTRKIPFTPEDHRIKQAKNDLLKILPSMQDASIDDPMNRAACDDPIRGCCPFQAFCWSATAVEVEELQHLYVRRASPSS